LDVSGLASNVVLYPLPFRDFRFSGRLRRRFAAKTVGRIVQQCRRVARAFWTFSNFYNKVEAAGAEAIASTRARALQIEQNAFAMQNSLEQAAGKLYKKDKAAASQMLTNYSRGVYLSALEAADELLSRK
jgi:hypothetical protein